MSVVFLIASVLGLLAGPLLYRALHARPRTRVAVDGFVLASIMGLVAVHVVPDSVEAAGWIAIAALAVGIAFPLVLERVEALSHRVSHAAVLLVALAALGLHAAIDGVGIASSGEGVALALAVVFHRLPVGLGVWWLVRPQFGVRAAIAVIALVIVATIVGWAVGTETVAVSQGWIAATVQAFVAGSLVHVLLHQFVGLHNHTEELDRSAPAPTWRPFDGLGGLLGGLLVLGLGMGGGHHEHHVFEHGVGVGGFLAPWILAVWAIGTTIDVASNGRSVWHRVLCRTAPWGVAAIIVGMSIASMPVATGPAAKGALAAVVAGALFVWFRIGPRDFALEVLPLPGGGHGHDDTDSHHHDHDSEPIAGQLVDAEVGG